ncbi:MAG: helix-turn-helix domain-containing protein [Kiritimatiellae bacterium]|nr:helix-turn-helix domain-containing protein [Kiritimatiellia bacterium]
MKYKSESASRSATLGALLRRLRKERKLPLRIVAGAAEMDSTLLSRIELGLRLPTEEQTRAFAAFFKVSFEELEAKRLAERFWMDHGESPAAEKAANLIREQAAEYKTKNNSKGGS